MKRGVTYAHAPASALADVVALRVHLDESTAGNGPLRVLPGTHALGILGDERINELARTLRSIDCIVGRGGVVVMRPLLVHASSKSVSEAPRRILHIEYAAALDLGSGLELAIA